MPGLSLPELRPAGVLAQVSSSRAVRIGLPVAIGTTSLAAADGGYFPTSWGWAALALLWVVAVALLARPVMAPQGLELVLLAALAALTAWIWLSAAWSRTPGASVLEGQRMLVYLSAVAALVLLARRSSLPALLGGLLAGVVAVAGYGLATRLFPERLSTYDPLRLYRLSEPLGYWNALGMFATIGVLVALGFVTHARTSAARAAAAASLAVLAPAQYFTFSRGAWIALAIGSIVAVALSERRLRLVTGVLVALPAPAIAVWLASRSDALTQQGSALADASEDGHRLALWLLLLVALGAVLSLARDVVDRRVDFGPRARRAYGAALVLAAAAVVTAVLVQAGGPVSIATRGRAAFVGPPPHVGVDLNKRLFSFSGNGRADFWQTAWAQFEGDPWLGTGAGSFEQVWYEHRDVEGRVRDAHSLYFETLAELGVVGLGLLATALAVPLVGAVRARRHALVPTAAGAYVAYLAHAGVDWDWEVPSVTVSALAGGAACLVASRRDEQPRPLRPGLRAGLLGVALVLLAAAFVGLVGNRALAESREAVRSGRWDIAETQARRATRWAPWSAEGWQRLGEVEVALSDPARARVYFRKAIARDPQSWLLWYELAHVARGEEQRRAARQVLRLNPLSAEAAELRQLAGL